MHLSKLYEGMFLLDNQVVRADWGRAKTVVTDHLQKHGAKVVTARRWDERKLAYAIRGKLRATYLLSYFEGGPEAVNAMRRDLELDERVLRYLILGAEALPEGELEKSQAESAADFSVPPPPEDEHFSREQDEFGHLGEARFESDPAEEEVEPVPEEVAGAETVATAAAPAAEVK
jgi:ribosomal protein S6